MSVATVHGNLSVPENKNVNHFFQWLMGLKHLNIFRYKKQDVSWTSTKKTALDYNDKPTTTKNKTIMI